MNPKQPETYPRRILLMVTGRSPQVVTETIYALCVTQDPPFVPTEVQIITTSEGAQDVRLSLLSDDPGWFQRLRRDWNLPEMLFGPEQIQVLLDGNKQPLSDIRTSADNDHTADFIVDRVRQFTADNQCALHVSLAGGRKTMGYFLGYALSLYGRAQDRLSHVLVSSPFESNRDFYYPTPNSRVIYTSHAASAQQRPLDAKDGEVMLADIPFVRLRDSLASPLKGLQTGTLKFGDVVVAAQMTLEQPAVTIDYSKGCVYIAGSDTEDSTVEFSPADLAFYGWLARRRKEGKESVLIASKSLNPNMQRRSAIFAEHLQEYRAEAERMKNSENSLSGRELNNATVMTYDFFHQRKTSIKESLVEKLGPLAARYEIRLLTKGRPGRYGLDIAPERIKFINVGT